MDDDDFPMVNEMQLASLREALEAGIAELNAGLGVEASPQNLVAEISEKLGIEP